MSRPTRAAGAVAGVLFAATLVGCSSSSSNPGAPTTAGTAPTHTFTPLLPTSATSSPAVAARTTSVAATSTVETLPQTPKCKVETAYWVRKSDRLIEVTFSFVGYETVSIEAVSADNDPLGFGSGIFEDGYGSVKIALSQPASKVAEVSLTAAGDKTVTCDVTQA